jgi:5'-3' exonuclease
MGVKGLFKYLSQRLAKENKQYIYNNLEEFVLSYKRRNNKEFISCVIDLSNILYPYKRANKDNHPIMFYNLIKTLYRSGVSDIDVCLEGTSPDEKKSVIKYRKDKREREQRKILNIKEESDIIDKKIRKRDKNSIQLLEKKQYCNIIKDKLLKSVTKIDGNDIDKIIKMCELFNIRIIMPSGEADACCAKLNRCGERDLVLTNDMDHLPLGAGTILVHKYDVFYEFNRNVVLKMLGFETEEQFINFCVLMGCEYSRPSPIPKLDLDLSFFDVVNEKIKLIRTYKTIYKIMDAGYFKQYKQYLNTYEKAINVYTSSLQSEDNIYEYLHGIIKIDADAIMKYLHDNIITIHNNSQPLGKHEKQYIRDDVKRINSIMKSKYKLPQICYSCVFDEDTKNITIVSEKIPDAYIKRDEYNIFSPLSDNKSKSFRDDMYSDNMIRKNDVQIQDDVQNQDDVQIQDDAQTKKDVV